MLYRLLWQKSKVLLLLFSLLAITFLASNTRSNIVGWQESYDFFYSDYFAKDFKANNYYLYESNGSQKKVSLENYRTHQLEVNPKKKSFPYTPTLLGRERLYFRYDSLSKKNLLCIFLVLAFGFSMCFWDLKSKFNTFLFSLQYSRKQLFRSKFILYSLFLLGTIFIGSVLSEGMIYFSIPEKYIHWDWLQTLYAIFSCCLSYYFLFVIGVFLGVILGNLFTGPMIITFVALLYTLFQQSIAFYPHWEDWLGTAVHDAAFNGMHPKQIILYALLIAAFLFLSNHYYQRLSLETNGQFLQFSYLRLPAFLTMSIATTLVIISYIRRSSYITHLGDYIYLFILFLIITMLSAVIVYYQTWLDRWAMRKEGNT